MADHRINVGEGVSNSMSMEQRITTLEQVTEQVIVALRASNVARERIRQGAALRDQAMMELSASVDRLADTVRRMQVTVSRLEESGREIAEASQRSDEAVQALMAYLPITQAEIVRLDNRIDSIEEA